MEIVTSKTIWGEVKNVPGLLMFRFVTICVKKLRHGKFEVVWVDTFHLFSMLCSNSIAQWILLSLTVYSKKNACLNYAVSWFCEKSNPGYTSTSRCFKHSVHCLKTLGGFRCIWLKTLLQSSIWRKVTSNRGKWSTISLHRAKQYTSSVTVDSLSTANTFTQN